MSELCPGPDTVINRLSDLVNILPLLDLSLSIHSMCDLACISDSQVLFKLNLLFK